ncbi:MAG TPA: PQQ-binding-like beta-propeller repeat protein [Ktedonobacterales bacterium]
MVSRRALLRAMWGCVSVATLVLAGCARTSTHPAHITPITLTPGAVTPVPVTDADWTMYHHDAARTGYVTGMPDPQNLTSLWQTSLDGAVYAEPLVVGGMVVAATERNNIYGLDARTGQIRWHVSLGAPVPLDELPCGNIDPLGVTGTPTYDPRTGLVFAVAEIAGPAHVLVGIDVKTGQIHVRRSADPSGMDPRAHQQRAALALVGDLVYVPYGGLYGDCGDYHGMVVASRTDGTGDLLTFQVPTDREGGIWAPPGPVLDTQGHLYVSVGNGAATGGAWDYTDSILRLSPTLQLEDGFAPASWASDNASDADLGSLGPVLLPDGFIYANGKSGQGYLMRTDHLGGIGGQLQTIDLCSAYGGAAVSDRTMFIPCTDGLRQVTLSADDHLTAGWHAPAQVSGSPVVGGQTVYAVDPDGTLYALDAGTGAVRATCSIGATSRFATPTLAQGRVFIGTLSGVIAVSAA